MARHRVESGRMAQSPPSLLLIGHLADNFNDREGEVGAVGGLGARRRQAT
jgi:hypothetical protein